MKNLPSYKEFSKYDYLMESISSEQTKELYELSYDMPDRSINEGKMLDIVKNNLSKFFLGKFSKISALDQAREVLVKLEIDLIEKKNDFEKEIDELNSKIDDVKSSEDKQRLTALNKDRENKLKEFENYEKTTRLKMKKAQEIARDIIDGNPRRRKYYEAGRSEDEITIAETLYKIAQKKSDRSEIKKYEEQLKKAKEEAQKKAEEIKSEMQSGDENHQETIKLLSVDPEKEKRKISGKKGKDVLDRIEELETSIVKLRTRLQRKLNMIEKRAQGGKKLPESFIENKKMELLSISATIDAQRNLLSIFRKLGKTESEITKKLISPKTMNQILSQINSGIDDGQNVNTGLKKVISSIFTGPEGVDTKKIKSAKEKIDD